MRYTKKGVIIDKSASAGDVDDAQLTSISAFWKNGKIYSFYGGYDGSSLRVCLYITDDYHRGVKKGVTVPLGAVGEIDDVHTGGYGITHVNFRGHDILYYGTGDPGPDYKVAAAYLDNMRIIKKGAVIPLGSGGEFDAGASSQGCGAIVVHEKIYLFYVGSTSITGCAVSCDGLNFVKKGVTIPLGSGGEVDDFYAGVYGVVPLFINNKFYVFYGAADSSANRRVALVISDEGLRYVKKGIVVPLGSGGEIDDTNSAYGIGSLGEKYIYYIAGDGIGGTFREALAIRE